MVKILFNNSSFLKKKKLLNKIGPGTWSKINAKLVKAEATKNIGGSPFRPIVPGPVISARTLTRENTPEIIPNPRPETEKIKFYLQV